MFLSFGFSQRLGSWHNDWLFFTVPVMIWAITWLIHVILLGDFIIWLIYCWVPLVLDFIGVGFQIFSLLDVWLIYLGMFFGPKKRPPGGKSPTKKTFGRAYCDLWLLVTNKDGIDDNSMALRVLLWFNVVDSALLWWIILNYGFNHAVFSGHLGGKKLGSLGWSWDSQWIQKVVRHAKKAMSFYENMVPPNEQQSRVFFSNLGWDDIVVNPMNLTSSYQCLFLSHPNLPWYKSWCVIWWLFFLCPLHFWQLSGVNESSLTVYTWPRVSWWQWNETPQELNLVITIFMDIPSGKLT